jgi:hypothetical protein
LTSGAHTEEDIAKAIAIAGTVLSG